jgi:hypothetical protein
MPLAIGTSSIEVDANIDAIIGFTEVVDQSHTHRQLTVLLQLPVLCAHPFREVKVFVVDSHVVAIGTELFAHRLDAFTAIDWFADGTIRSTLAWSSQEVWSTKDD